MDTTKKTTGANDEYALTQDSGIVITPMFGRLTEGDEENLTEDSVRKAFESHGVEISETENFFTDGAPPEITKD